MAILFQLNFFKMILSYNLNYMYFKAHLHCKLIYSLLNCKAHLEIQNCIKIF